MLANIITLVGTFLVFLDIVLSWSGRYSHVRLLQIGALMIGIGVLLGAHGFLQV